MKKLLLIAFSALTCSAVFSQVQNYTVGQVVSNFTVTTTDGTQLSLYDITAGGQYVMLDFFFDTCPPCQATSNFFNETHQTYGCNSGQIFLLSVNNGTDSDAEVIAFENTYGGPWNHAPAVSSQGGGGTVTNQFGIAAYPTYCLIGPDNKLVNADIWPINNMGTFVAAFPANSGIQPAACSNNVNETAVVQDVISVFPVPANNELNINVAIEGQATYTIYGMLGQAVASGNITDGRVRVATNHLSEGQYVVEVLSNSQIIRRPFTVVR